MRLVVFGGPTLSRAEIAAALPCTILPPARQGDVWRAVHRHRPQAIGLIDGAFRDVRAVWHREILWALSQGVHVFGAASMGALRAAELDRYGMRGIGRVYEAYRDGVWPGFAEPFEDDDEVAVQHAPEELGYAPLSDAMVDLRETLLAAEAAGVIDGAARVRLTAGLKAMPYPDRNLRALDVMAGAALSDHHVPRKKLDAMALLHALAALREAAPAPFVPGFRFEQTLVWRRFTEQARRDLEPGEDPAAEAVLDELRLDPTAWQACALAAEGRSATGSARPADLPRTLAAFRLARGLLRRAELDAWLAANGLGEAGLVQLLQQDPDRAVVAPPTRIMADHLRATGRFTPLHDAAEARRRASPGPATATDLAVALDWYFDTMAGGERPADLGLFWAVLGWRDSGHFEHAVWTAYCARTRAPKRG
ncbi:MAG: TfuA-like protein [Acetobacteraceae bacterium]